MIKINNPLIMRTQNPNTIKDLLLKATGSMIYDPIEFVADLLKIIKRVFVKTKIIKRDFFNAEALFNRILKNDEANKLEKMRENIETAYLIENS
jgi:hypothetical protein